MIETRRGRAAALLLACALALAGCTTLGAKPWQRGLLARDDMRLDGETLDNSLDEHVYFSKEASSGGRGFGGGGCGCN